MLKPWHFTLVLFLSSGFSFGATISSDFIGVRQAPNILLQQHDFDGALIGDVYRDEPPLETTAEADLTIKFDLLPLLGHLPNGSTINLDTPGYAYLVDPVTGALSDLINIFAIHQPGSFDQVLFTIRMVSDPTSAPIPGGTPAVGTPGSPIFNENTNGPIDVTSALFDIPSAPGAPGNAGKPVAVTPGLYPFRVLVASNLDTIPPTGVNVPEPANWIVLATAGVATLGYRRRWGPRQRPRGTARTRVAPQ